MTRRKIVSMNEAETHFSELLGAVIRGDEITIVLEGKPVAQLIPVAKKPVRRPGMLKGKIWMAKDFDAPLPDHILEDFSEA